MKHRGRNFFFLFFMAVGVFAVVSALEWPFRAALFPLIMGVPLFFMALAEIVFDPSRRGETEKRRQVLDFELSGEVDQPLAARRTVFAFLWIIGFFLLIIFFGFIIAVPLFILLYLKIQGRETWGISLILTGSAWAFLYGLFVRLLNTPFEGGWLWRILRMG